jgi:hypothetical protein
MEIIRNLLTRMRRTGVLVIIGFILIIYISLGFLYWQQGAQQTESTAQINKLSAVLDKPLSPITELQAECDNVTRALAPMTDIDAIDTLLSIAKKSGINTDENAGKFSVPPVTTGSRNVGSGNYRLLSFKGISVSGNYTDVMAFIIDLDSGKTLENMVLTAVILNKVGGGEWAEAEAQAIVDVDIYTKP